ncbi:MAG: hypothetical protein ACI90M_000376, partial [Candidatus Azotimanducaceae bacterium]
RFNSSVNKWHGAINVQAGLFYEDAVKFKKEALLVGDLGHCAEGGGGSLEVAGGRDCSRLPMASANSAARLTAREKRPEAGVWNQGLGLGLPMATRLVS